MNQISSDVQTSAEIQQPERAIYVTPTLENHAEYKALTGVPASGF